MCILWPIFSGIDLRDFRKLIVSFPALSALAWPMLCGIMAEPFLTRVSKHREKRSLAPIYEIE